jgi:hypothetical protein
MNPGLGQVAFGPPGPQAPPLLQRLEWVKSLLELLLLLLALPWVAYRIWRDGTHGLRDLGEDFFG